jgi:hypothetical protein
MFMLTRPSRTLLMFLMLVMFLLALFGVGCAGDTARVRALGPAMAQSWPAVNEDAQLGVRARENPAAAAALNVEAVDPVVADMRRERLKQFGIAVGRLYTR